MESQTRTIIKTVSWRIFGTLITAAVVWKMTGRAELGLSVGTLDCLIKLIGYYLHERAWNSIGFGYQADPAPHSFDLSKSALELDNVDGCCSQSDLSRVPALRS